MGNWYIEHQLEAQMEFSGVQAWHDAGRKGAGINIWNTEGKTTHSDDVMSRLRDGAPEANLFQAEMSFQYDNEKITKHTVNYQNKDYDIEEFIDRFKIDVITRSVQGGQAVGTPESLYFQDLRRRYPIILFGCGGNKSNAPVAGSSFPSDTAYWVSQGKINKNGRPVYDSTTSAPGPEIDFCDFPGFLNGTSFCAPFTAARAALLKGVYGRSMHHEELFKFLARNCVDLEEVGVDGKVGYGLPVMPDVSRKYITLTAGNQDYFVDGVIQAKLPTPPVNMNGTVFVPLRVIGEALGKTFTYKAISNGVVYVGITDGVNLVQLTTGTPVIWVNGAKKILEFAPYIQNPGYTMVPIRAIAEAFDCKVDWVQEVKRVMILEA